MNTNTRIHETPRKQRVFLVDDHPITREGFAHLINYQSDLQVCGEAATAARALVRIAVEKPDLVIVDLSLPGESGLDLIKEVRAAHRALPVMVLSTHDESIYAERALQAGAQGYIMKQAPTGEVMQAIRQVLRGEIYLSEPIRARVVHKHLHGPASLPGSRLEQLSDRELEVFQRIGRGQTTRQIAKSLRLSVSTVDGDRSRIREKLRLAGGPALKRRAAAWAKAEQV